MLQSSKCRYCNRMWYNNTTCAMCATIIKTEKRSKKYTKNVRIVYTVHDFFY